MSKRKSSHRTGKRHASRKLSKAHASAPRTAEEYYARPEKFKDVWDRVVSVVSKMRSEKTSLQKAAQEYGISPSTVKRWAGSALQKRSNGKWGAKKNDNLLRLLTVPTPEGTREVAVRGSRQATQLAEYWNALHHYLATGDDSRLENFRGQSVKDAEGVQILFPTDRALLTRLGSAGVLSFESLYSRSA
jgi:hypothetical protein